MSVKVAIVTPGDREARRGATAENSKVAGVFPAFAAAGIDAVPAIYHDDLSGEVKGQLLEVDAALVWINPIQGGRDRSVLDALLREVSAAGVFVSTHPDVILRIGTKEVLYRTQDIGWGCATYLYRTPEDLSRELPKRLDAGETRVLKQYRGNGGDGVWKVAGAGAGRVRARHAKRGCEEEDLPLGEFTRRMEPYFAGGAPMIDQAWQPRISDGTIRCYLVQGRVEGFGHQAINALHPDAAEPGSRLYHPPSMPEFRRLKRLLEDEWVPAMQRMLEIETDRLPLLWDCDFMFGPGDASDGDSYVLCEINVSSVSPFPDSALSPLARATRAAAEAAKHRRSLPKL